MTIAGARGGPQKFKDKRLVDTFFVCRWVVPLSIVCNIYRQCFRTPDSVAGTGLAFRADSITIKRMQFRNHLDDEQLIKLLISQRGIFREIGFQKYFYFSDGKCHFAHGQIYIVA
jgi:hypothetical protein